MSTDPDKLLDGYETACQRIVEIAEDRLAGRIDDTAAILAIHCIAQAAPNDPGEDWTKPPARSDGEGPAKKGGA